jgi:transposase
MKDVATIGVDLAKNIFQIYGTDCKGRRVLEKRVKRDNLLNFFVNLKPCIVGMEACGGSHHWARELEKLGHTAKQMPPQYVKPYVKTNKNDRNDAEAICEAVTRPNMHFVPTKSVEQQDIQALHRCRERQVKNRTALSNQARALLLEIGIAVPKGFRYLRTVLPELVGDTENILTPRLRELLADMYSEFVDVEARIKHYDKELEVLCQESEACGRLRKMPGFGPLSATAFVAAIGDATVFRNGRQVAAWLGLVPRQHSSGNKQWLGGISKRGNTYLRTLLIHGGRAFLRHCGKRADKRSQWLAALMERRGNARASVAWANKMARIGWALLVNDDEYKFA